MASVDNKIVEIFIPGPAGRLEAKYFKSKKNTSPIALVLHPHPQYGGTMNNKIVVDIFQTFVDNDFSFLSPCPTSGTMIYGKKDELVPIEHINDLNKRLSEQKGIKVEFEAVQDANHFFSKSDLALIKSLNKYIKKETALY